VNTHLGIEQSRRDDLEGLGYVFMYFIRGSLPWQGLRAGNKKEKYDRIMDKKMSTPVEILCKNSPAELATYLNYCRALRFEDRPDYAYLKRMFKDLFFRENYQYDFIFDWTILNFSSKTPSQPEETKEEPVEEEKAEVRRPAEEAAGPKRTNEQPRKQAGAISGARNPPQNSRK